MYERMLDKLNTPTFEEMAETCGENRERFIQINEWLAAGCIIELQMKLSFAMFRRCWN